MHERVKLSKLSQNKPPNYRQLIDSNSVYKSVSTCQLKILHSTDHTLILSPLHSINSPADIVPLSQSQVLINHIVLEFQTRLLKTRLLSYVTKKRAHDGLEMHSTQMQQLKHLVIWWRASCFGAQYRLFIVRRWRRRWQGGRDFGLDLLHAVQRSVLEI